MVSVDPADFDMVVTRTLKYVVGRSTNKILMAQPGQFHFTSLSLPCAAV